MDIFHNKRSACSSSSLKSLTCHHHLSRRLFQRRLYRTSIFISIFMFVIFEFHTKTSLQAPWPPKTLYNASKTNASFSISNPSSISVKNNSMDSEGSVAKVKYEDSEDSESFLDKIEYGIIKFLMGKIIAAHEKRQKAAAAAVINKSIRDRPTTHFEKITQRKPLEHLKNDEEMDNNNNVNNSNHTYVDNNKAYNAKLLQPKTILLYTKFFGRRNWTGIFGNGTDLITHHCPVTNCVFTLDISKASEADALIFHSRDFRSKAIPKDRKSHQRYIWLNHEAPGMENAGLSQVAEGFFNWTYTYHRNSDILLLYGGLQPLQESDDNNTTRPGLLNISGGTYREYLAALEEPTLKSLRNNLTLQDKAEHEEKGSHTNTTNHSQDQRKLIAWMVSHCNTWSGRELYVQELSQYVAVDVYGKCGPLTCGRTHHDSYCYSDVLAPNYKFYLSFENSMCNDYITEKVWYPLHYGLVPIVYGGVRYQDYLPPYSYIDATNMSPPQLATLLNKLGSNSQLYNKYHLWRNYWRVLVPPPMCELCQRLHMDHTPATVKNPQNWWKEVNNCSTRYSFEEYPRHDLRLIVSKVDAGVKLFRKILRSFL